MSDPHPDHPFHPDKWPGCEVHHETGLAIGAAVWEERRLHHHLSCDPSQMFVCGCGRKERADATVDLRAVPPDHRPFPTLEFACSYCVQSTWWRGHSHPGDLHRAQGAPEHIAALSDTLVAHVPNVRRHQGHHDA